MRKIAILILTIFLSIVLSSCGGKTRKDDFFSSKELDSLYLNDLPKIKYSSSLLKTYEGSMEGYFTVKKDDFVNYSEEVLSYFKNSDCIYGGIIPGTRSSLAGAFPCFNWTTYDHACLYANDNDSYLFIYKPNGEDNEYCISIEYGSFKQKDDYYSVCIKIKSTTIAREYISKDKYLELELTKEYIEENSLINVNYKKYTYSDHESLYISFDIGIVTGKIDIDVNTMYHGNKEKIKLKCYPFYASLITNLLHYYDIIKPYSDGDLQIIDYVINEGIIVIENK